MMRLLVLLCGGLAYKFNDLCPTFDEDDPATRFSCMRAVEGPFQPADFTLGGQTQCLGCGAGEMRRKPFPSGTTSPTQVLSHSVFRELVTKDTHQPVWSEKLWALHRVQLDAGQPLSVPAYPHSAEDIVTAATSFASDRRAGEWAVFSSISPWAEATLFHWGVRNVTTVDYNVPVSAGDPWGFPGCRHRTLSMAELAEKNAKGHLFDVIVTFSGIEHDGLSRYGDPLHPDGDAAAMHEMMLSLKPGGLLLLGVPTADVDQTAFPWHRVYGPKRLPWLLAPPHVATDYLGRVWDGRVVPANGGDVMATAADEPILFAAKGRGGVQTLWQHQQVLVLRRRA